MATKGTQWAEAASAIAGAVKILVVTHVSPDGDAIGSLLGLGAALREQGKKVTLAVDGGVPEFLGFLPGAASVEGRLKHGHWDVMISVDASDEERTGVSGALGRARSPITINLDHHATNTGFGDIHLVMPEAVSATEVVYHWLRFMQHPVSAPAATALLAGLVTDTLGFRTSNVSADTLGVAQALMAAGAPLAEITARALVIKPYRSIELLKRTMPSVRLENGIVSGVVTQGDIQAAGFSDTTDGGLIGMLAPVQEAVVAAVFKETPEGKVEISLRSRDGYNVAQVAFALGGGGHVQAAGATLPGPLADAQARVMPMLEAVVKAGPDTRQAAETGVS